MPLLTALGIIALALVVTPILAKHVGRATGWVLAVAYLLATAALWPATARVLEGQTVVWAVPWIEPLGIQLRLSADGLGMLFAHIALLVGAVVMAYSARYLKKQPNISFFVVMVTFTLAMMGLVFAGDLILLFVCWEITSLASFLLIARSGHSAELPAMRTLLLTFLGGLSFLAATTAIWVRMGTTDLSVVFTSPLWQQQPGFTATMAVLVAVAAFTKAAQFPFHVWLPGAMAAITPVSAYLHAAAVVKAGIFLLMRFSPLFHDVLVWNLMLIIVGLVTSFVGGWFALQATDLKRLMAYSTVSQLGLIVATVGIGTGAALTAALFHTVVHAMFKSGLFMMIGVVDHATGTRDMRRLPKGLWRQMPVSFAVMVLGALSMAGVPPFLGFISKEGLLDSMLEAPGESWFQWLVFVTMALSAVLTMAYCIRLVFGGFVDGTNTAHDPELEDPVFVASASLPILATLPLAVVPGLLDRPLEMATVAAFGKATEPVHLALWHGITPALIATLLVLASGVVIVLNRKRVFARAAAHEFPFNGDEAISAIIKPVRRLGVWIDHLTSADDAHRHLFPILGAVAVLGIVGGPMVVLGGAPDQQPGLNRASDYVLFVLLAAAVAFMCVANRRLSAIIGLSAVGVLCVLQIMALGAPDVVLTQLLVESLSIIVIMLVAQKLPARFPRRKPKFQRVAIVVSVLVGAGVTGLAWALNARRDKADLGQYFLDFTRGLSGGENVVNVILVEFRALDTMGELTVLGMAGIAVVAVLSTVRDKYLDPPTPDPDALHIEDLALRGDPSSSAYRAITVSWSNNIGLQIMVRVLVPILVVLSLFFFWRGHNAPGGGFNAALVASGLVGLMYLSTFYDRRLGPPRLASRFIGSGILLSLATGFLGLVVKGSFLQPIHGDVFGVHLTTSLLFDAGVYLAVLGLILESFNILGATNRSGSGGDTTRERVDEFTEGELSGPLDTVRGESRPRVKLRSTHLHDDERPGEVGVR